MDRRHFLHLAGLATGTLATGTLAADAFAAGALPERLLADPYAPLGDPRARLNLSPVRITGRVHVDGKGVAGVRVSDGATVVTTARDGRYTLLADPLRPFVMVSTPAGHEPARNPAGTMRFYESITALEEQRVDFELTPTVDDANHTMLLLADPQTKTREETDMMHTDTVPAVQEAVRALGEGYVFGVTCGDLMYDDLSLFPEYERAVTRMDLPFYQAIGNHDLEQAAKTSEAAGETYAAYFGPTYYSFDRGAVHYVVLDNVLWHGAGYIGYLDARQLQWLAADLATVQPGATVIVMLHIPPVSTMMDRTGEGFNPTISMTNKEALYRVLEPFNAFLLSGHTHELEHVSDGGATHVVNGAVCGAWWTGPICRDGTPNGFMIYDVRDSAVTWRYQTTGQSADHQLRVYKRGADVTAPDECVANVWAWDPSWTVTWSEDGTPRGVMSRRTELDPLSVELHAGPDKPARASWVDPTPTSHLFYATPSPNAREITVEARDGWGRVYRQSAAVAG